MALRSLSASGCPRYASAASTWRACCANGWRETCVCPKRITQVRVWTTVRLKKAVIADTYGHELKLRFMVVAPPVSRILHIQAAQGQGKSQIVFLRRQGSKLQASSMDAGKVPACAV